MKRSKEYYRLKKRASRAKAKEPKWDLMRKRIAFATLVEMGHEPHAAFLRVYGNVQPVQLQKDSDPSAT